MLCKADYAASVKPILPSLPTMPRLRKQLQMMKRLSLLSNTRIVAPGILVWVLPPRLPYGIMRFTYYWMGKEFLMARREPEDQKLVALRSSRNLNARPERVTDAGFLASPFFDARDLLQVKYEMIRRVQVDGIPVSHAAAAFGFSRPSYYQAAEAVEAEGLAGLLAERPGPRRAHKLTDEVIAFVLEQLAAGAAERPRELVDEIEARFGVRAHARSIERAVMRSSASKRGKR